MCYLCMKISVANPDAVSNTTNTNSVAGLGDPYYSEEILVDPFEVLFFKTNVKAHLLSKEVNNMTMRRLEGVKNGEREERGDTMIAFCFTGAPRSFVADVARRQADCSQPIQRHQGFGVLRGVPA